MAKTTTASVDQLLAAARGTMAEVGDCWAATPAADGGVDVRVVVPIAGIPGEEAWTTWFATWNSSRKAAQIRDAGRMALGYQNHAQRAYVALIGRAVIVED